MGRTSILLHFLVSEINLLCPSFSHRKRISIDQKINPRQIIIFKESLPFSGFRNVHEQLHFTEKIIETVKDILLKTEKLPLKVGCLYLYYALYQKQPLQNFIKMRITLSDCDKLHELLRLLKAHSELADARMVFMKLWSQQAFKFVAVDQEYLFVKSSKRSTQSHPTELFHPLNLRAEMEDIFDEEEGLVAGLELLEVAYNNMKEKLIDKDSNLSQSNISANIKSNLDKIALLLDKSKLITDQGIGELIKEEEPGTANVMTARARILDKISDIQRSKNTLDETPGPPSKKLKAPTDDGHSITFHVAEDRTVYEKKSFVTKTIED